METLTGNEKLRHVTRVEVRYRYPSQSRQRSSNQPAIYLPLALDVWLAHLDRYAKIHRLKITNDLGGHSSSFNKRMPKAELEGKLPNVKPIETINFSRE